MHFHHEMPLKFNLRAFILQNFLGGMPLDPRTSMLHMLIVVLRTINPTSNFTLYKGPTYILCPRPPNFSWRPCVHLLYLSNS